MGYCLPFRWDKSPRAIYPMLQILYVWRLEMFLSYYIFLAALDVYAFCEAFKAAVGAH
jgi:hypothetical protein